MKIVIAPDSFKESLTALEAAEAIETGFKKIFPHRILSKCQWRTAVKGRCNH